MGMDKRAISEYENKLKAMSLSELRDAEAAWRGNVYDETDFVCWARVEAEYLARGFSLEDARMFWKA